MELDVTVTSRKSSVARATYSELASFLTQRISQLGGTVTSRRETMR